MPAALWVLLLGPPAVCLAVAVVVTARATGSRTRDPLALAWLPLVLLAAAALVWNAAYSAAISAHDDVPIIPVFDCLFTFAPALLAGFLFSRRGREASWAAALGTGVVTLPLFALSFALLDSSGLSLAAAAGALLSTFILGVIPLAVTVVLAGTLAGAGLAAGGRAARLG